MSFFSLSRTVMARLLWITTSAPSCQYLYVATLYPVYEVLYTVPSTRNVFRT